MKKEHNGKIFPLDKKKAPMVGKGTDWRKYEGIVETKLRGVFIPNDTMIFDVDTYKGTTTNDIEQRLGCALDWEGAELQRTVRGGVHYAFRVPEGVNLINGTDVLDIKGFDTRVAGKGYIATGEGYENLTFWPDVVDALHQGDFPPLPAEAVELLTKVERVGGGDLGDFEGLLKNDTPEDDIRDMLFKLDPNMSNNEWVTVGMALHDWDSVKGLALWEEWSQGGETWQEGETAKRWRSFSSGGTSVGTLFHKAAEANLVNAVRVRDALVKKVEKADEIDLKMSVFKEIRNTEMNAEDREVLVVAIQNRVKALTGVKPTKAIVRPSITTAKPNGVEREDVPEWANGLVWCDHRSQYTYQDKRDVFYSVQGFNMAVGKYLEEGTNAHYRATTKGFAQVVTGECFYPWDERALVPVGNTWHLNTFNPDSVPVCAMEHTDDGLAYIERVKRHIKLLFNGSKQGKIFVQWLAHQVQYPGRKIRWAPLLVSDQGMGKGVLGGIISAVVGRQNFNLVDPDTVTDKYTDWAVGNVVTVINELYTEGHDRRKVANRLKQFITDDEISVREMYMRSYTTQATTNYLVFTNERSAIPLAAGDRRYWVIFVNNDDIRAVVKAEKDYFKALAEGIKTHVHEVRKWLMEYPISDEFKALENAPMTLEKESMILMESSGQNGRDEAEELLKKGSDYYNEDVIVASNFFEDLTVKHGIILDPKPKNWLLQDLGFVLSSKKPRIDGKQVRQVWVKPHHLGKGAAEIKKLLE